MDNKNNKIREFLIIYAGVFLVLWGYFHFFYIPNANEAEAKESEESVSENTSLEEVEEKTPYFSRHLSTNNFYQTIVVDGVYYLIYESGYGSSHSIAITPMYNTDGTIKTEDNVILQAPPANDMGGENETSDHH